MKEEYVALMRYGIELLRKRLGLSDSPLPSGALTEVVFSREVEEVVRSRLARAQSILGDDFPAQPAKRAVGITSPFCGIRYLDSDRTMDPYPLPLKRLQPAIGNSENEQPEELWSDFCAEIELIPPGAGAFETFSALIRKYGWSLRGATDFDAVSVFEQFKATVALTFCMRDQETEKVLLIAGDIPGIQKFLFTITSKGAAKSLRGRSFYLQILNDAIVRTILRELALPSACVIYNAGGNFNLLLPFQSAETLEKTCLEINRRLLKLHKGEIFLAHAMTTINIGDVVRFSLFSEARQDLNEKLQTAKRQAFAGLASEAYDDLFGVKGMGGDEERRCDVCHCETTSPPRKDNDKKFCNLCWSFRDLAQDISRIEGHPYLAVNEKPLADTSVSSSSSTWEEALGALGCRYTIGKPAKGDCTSLLRLDGAKNFIPPGASSGCAYGFSFLAHLTPRIRQNEGEKLQRSLGDDSPEDSFRDGDIRNTTVMAKYDASGIRRCGVLRMDVDHLGGVLQGERLQRPDLLHISALSAHLSLFFDGALNGLCKDSASRWGQSQEGNDRRLKTPYILYAGGDDLMLVAPWDVLPQLASDIRHEFGSYVTGGRSDTTKKVIPSPLTISAGLFVESSKFPLYRAAELAKDGLEDAKRYGEFQDRKGNTRFRKDAVTWLETTLGWDDFRHAFKLALKMAKLIGNGRQYEKDKERPSAPRSLLWLLRSVASEYRQNARSVPPDAEVYGSWMWKLAYGFGRLKDRLKGRRDGEAAKQVEEIICDCHDVGRRHYDVTRPDEIIRWQTVRFLDLPVRWAELLIRKEGGDATV